MKRSEELKLQAAQEDNDIKAHGIHTKALREHRSEKFADIHLPLLQAHYDLVYDGNGKYTIDTDTNEILFGTIDFFPKANKVLIRKQNRWIKPGLKWIIKNLISKITD